MSIFKLETIDDKSILTISDSIFPDNGNQFSDVLEKAVSAKSRLLIIDLSKVSIIYSLGITVLVKTTLAAKSSNIKLVLVGVQENVMKVFKLCRFDTLFQFAPTLEDALKG